jgi:hypothetical protein
MKKYFAVLSLAFILPSFSTAQNMTDALRYSGTQISGTARSGGMGNAFGALGGDFTSVGINPAGLGLYRSSEFAITPSFGQTTVNSNYLNNNMSDRNYNLSLGNISYVSSIKAENHGKAGLLSVNIGIGYNRLKDFNSNSFAGGNNAGGSILDNFASNANSGNWSDFYEQLAWETDLLYKDEKNIYRHDMEYAGYGQSHQKSISRRGSMDEYSFAVGLNFNHKLYVGASVGIIDLYYQESSSHKEFDQGNRIESFNELQFNSFLQTGGTGYNGKLGLIYRPASRIRLGVSVHTPNFYNLNDIFETSMSSSITYTDGETVKYHTAIPPVSEYDYSLETPFRAIFSGAFIFGNKGLVSLDYEYVDYGRARLSGGGDGYHFTAENGEISSAYKSAGNLRIGGEYRFTDYFSLRAGYENYPSAYSAASFGFLQPNSGTDLSVYSCGIGYRIGAFYLDASYRYSDSEAFEMLYPAPVSDNYPSPEMASFKSMRNKVMLTFGIKL